MIMLLGVVFLLFGVGMKQIIWLCVIGGWMKFVQFMMGDGEVFGCWLLQVIEEEQDVLFVDGLLCK